MSLLSRTPGPQIPARTDEPFAEARFVNAYRAAGLTNTMYVSAIGAVICLMVMLDRLQSGEGTTGFMTIRSVQLATFLCWIALAAVSRDWLLRRYVQIGCAYLAVSLGLAGAAVYASTLEPLHAPLRLMVASAAMMFCFYVFLRIPVKVLAILGWTSAIAMIGILQMRGITHEAMAATTIYLLSANAIGSLLCHSMEARERALFGAIERAEALSSERAQLINELAHDLRGPLAAIGNEVVNLGSQAGSIVGVQAAKRMALLSSSVEDLRDHLEHLLELCRAVGTQHQAVTEGVPISRLFESLEREFEPRMRAVQVEFIRSLDGGDPSELCVRSNPVELRAILANLIDNAIKYRDPARAGGQRVELRVGVAGDRITVSVIDNGIGIAANHLSQVWRAGFRVRESGRRINGAGYGLAIVKARVDHLDGHDIQIRSEPGVGTEVALCAPRWNLATGVLPGPAGRQAMKGSVLLLSRHGEWSRRLQDALSAQGIAGAVAEDAEQAAAVVAAASGVFDVVIVNARSISLAQGLEALAAIRTDQGFDVPGVLLAPLTWRAYEMLEIGRSLRVRPVWSGAVNRRLLLRIGEALTDSIHLQNSILAQSEAAA